MSIKEWNPHERAAGGKWFFMAGSPSRMVMFSEELTNRAEIVNWGSRSLKDTE